MSRVQRATIPGQLVQGRGRLGLRRLLLALGLLGAFLVGIPTPADSEICFGTIRGLTPRPQGYEQVVVGTTAVALTVPAKAELAVAVVEDADIRFRDDGPLPTATVGTFVGKERAMIICPDSLTPFRAIRDTGATKDAKLSVHYYGGSP